jgi:hypothetical protein
MKPIEIQLDKLWSAIILFPGKCERCGSRINLDPHHIFIRGNRSTRWELDNGCCLCGDCHTAAPDAAHRDIDGFRQWIINERGQEWFDDLNFRSHQTVHWTQYDLEIKLEVLKEVLEGLKN